MKRIYSEILSEGENGVSSNSGENAKGENLGLIAGAELFRMVELFPEMLEMLKALRKEIGDTIIGRTGGWNKKVDELIAKAEGVE